MPALHAQRQRLAALLQVQQAHGTAMQAPAVAARPGVGVFQRRFGRQHMRGDGRGGQLGRQRRCLEKRGTFTLDERGVQVGRGEGMAAHHPPQKGHVGGRAHQVGVLQGRVQPRQRLGACFAPDDELGDHAVVVRADGVALADAAVHARDGLAAREGHVRRPARDVQRAGGGQEVSVRVLGANARFDGVAAMPHLVLGQRQRLAIGHAQLPFHEVQAGDGFRHRVLHLQARVHLHEISADVPVVQFFGDELHRARTHVSHGLGCSHRSGAHLGAARSAQARCGAFFQHLLVAALHRTIAFAQVDDVAVHVAEDLNLDVPRPHDITLNQHVGIAEAGLRFTLAAGQRSFEVLRLIDAPHALATAARAGLDQHRVADARGLIGKEGGLVVVAVIAGHQPHTGFFHQRLGCALAAHGRDGAGRRADEDQPCRRAGVGEFLVLAEETVAGVNGLRAGGQRGVDDALPLQITLTRRVAADVHGLVAGVHVARIGVGVAVDGHRAHAQALRRGSHAAGNLAAVGNEQLLKHAKPPQ